MDDSEPHIILLMSKMERCMGELLRLSKLIERGQIYFQCGEEVTTAASSICLGTIVCFGLLIFRPRESWIWPK
jgi:hypothetical protein